MLNIARKIFRCIRFLCYAHQTKFRYARTLRRLRREFGHRKLKVAFFVSEISKWKGQSLFERMAASDYFEPYIAVFPSARELAKSYEVTMSETRAKIAYFRQKGMVVKEIWNGDTNGPLESSQVASDIVFYQQPWDIPSEYSPHILARYALTFYFPYFLVVNFEPEIDLCQWLHFMVYRHIVLNKPVADSYIAYINSRKYASKYVGAIVPLGHPTTDAYLRFDRNNVSRNLVIYAPHWSFEHPSRSLSCHYSTFLQNGKEILAYAKSHPEINWAFKPHPNLKCDLISTGVWSEAEVEEYWHSWETIGESCYTADYAEMFMGSRAMITDCSSFLAEYSCVNKPLIRLVSSRNTTQPHPAMAKLFDTFYNVHNLDEMLKTFDSVLLRGEDPQAKDRRETIKELGLAETCAADNIMVYLDHLMLK